VFDPVIVSNLVSVASEEAVQSKNKLARS
jgi:hypothetical protein